MDNLVSVYDGINPEPKRNVDLHEVFDVISGDKLKKQIEEIRAIKDPDPKREKELRNRKKKILPSMTAAGTFTHRKNEGIDASSGYFLGDIDHINVEPTFEKLKNDPNIFAMWRSPSGDGLKVVIQTTGFKNDAEYKIIYKAVEHYFKKNYDINFDPSCKDISRATFLSHDPAMFINDNPKIFELNTHSGNNDSNSILSYCYKRIAESVPHEQHRIRRDMARLLGGYIASGLVDEALAYEALAQAVIDSGAVDIEASMRTVKDGVEHGKKSPINEFPKDNLPHRGFFFQRVGETPITEPEFLIEDMFERDSINSLVGDTGSYKTFILVDLATAVAGKMDFEGRKTEHGPVVIIAGEGNRALPRRIAASAEKYGADYKNLIIYVSSCAAQLDDKSGLQEVIKSINDLPEKPILIINDTLNRNSCGNENDSSDMTKIVHAMDELRMINRCTVITSHHTGLSDKSRGRGSSVLKAAVDSEYLVKKTGEVVTLQATKIKDGELPPIIPFKLQPCETVVDGKVISSAFLTTPLFEHQPILSPNMKKALAVLSRLKGVCQLDEWEKGCKSIYSRSDSFKRAVKTLSTSGVVEVDEKTSIVHIVNLEDVDSCGNNE